MPTGMDSTHSHDVDVPAERVPGRRRSRRGRSAGKYEYEYIIIYSIIYYNNSTGLYGYSNR
jgi:hypothetical protein